MSAIHFKDLLLIISLSLESPALNINHLMVTYGQQLSIMMTSVTEKLVFTSVNKQPLSIWSRRSKSKKGQVIQTGEERRFLLDSVTFDDQGNYTEWNFWGKVASVHLVTVLCKFFSHILFSLFFPSVPFTGTWA